MSGELPYILTMNGREARKALSQSFDYMKKLPTVDDINGYLLEIEMLAAYNSHFRLHLQALAYALQEYQDALSARSIADRQYNAAALNETVPYIIMREIDLFNAHTRYMEAIRSVSVACENFARYEPTDTEGIDCS